MKAIVISALILLTISCNKSKQLQFTPVAKSRVIVLTDMLNEPDDSQTMVRLLMYANRMDIEGLIAVSSCHQYKGKNDEDTVRNNVHPEEIIKRIKAYGQVRDNLLLHEDGWPTVEYLLSKVGSGPAGFGMWDVGPGKSTTGSELIVEALKKDDERPLYVCINAGANCLAQALIDLKAQTDSGTFYQLLKKLRVYDDAGQDNAGAWIAGTYPEIHYQRSQYQVFNFMNEKGPITWDTACYPGEGQHRWAAEHVQNNHGPLGTLYPVRRKWKRPDVYHTLEGGGTSTWIGHVNHGLYVPEQMTWGGWGGRFNNNLVKNPLALQLKWANLVETENEYKPFYMYVEATDNWTDPETGITYNDIGTAIYRWRRAYQNDFEARMDWCVKPYNEANHNPIATINGNSSNHIVFITAKPGEKISFDASNSSDPDGDPLTFYWYVYTEAGSYDKNIDLNEQNSESINFTVPSDASGHQIHLILEIKDNNPIVPLHDYRRIVIDIN